MGVIDLVLNPIPGMVIEYDYRDTKGRMTITDVVKEASGMVRVYYIDEMEGEEHRDAMYIDSAWNILIEKIIKVTNVSTGLDNPEWEI